MACDFLLSQFTRVFLHLNNPSNNKWFDFKISFRNVCTIIPFLTCSLIGYLKPIMPEFDHVLAQGWAPSLYSLTNFPNFSIIFPSFFHSTLNVTPITPSFNCRYPLVHVHTFHWPYGYSPLMLHSWQRAHGFSWCSS